MELCTDVGQLETRLGEIDVTNISTDARLFAEMEYTLQRDPSPLHVTILPGASQYTLCTSKFFCPINVIADQRQINVQERYGVGICDKPLALAASERCQQRALPLLRMFA